MLQVIETANELVDKEGTDFLYRWDSALPAGTTFVPIEKVCLYIMRKEDGDNIFQRVMHQRDAKKGNLVSWDFNAALYRIANGKRKGWVLPLSKIQEGEEYCPAGIHKKLACGKTPDTFRASHKSDRDLVEMIHFTLAEEEVVDVDYICPPQLWTHVSDENTVNLRRDSRIAEVVSTLPGYSDGMSAKESLALAKASFGLTRDDKRYYPHDMFVGAGTLCVADLGYGSGWKAVQKEALIVKNRYHKFIINGEEGVI